MEEVKGNMYDFAPHVYNPIKVKFTANIVRLTGGKR